MWDLGEIITLVGGNGQQQLLKKNFRFSNIYVRERERERERVIFSSDIEERTEMADDQVLGILIIKLKDNFINIFVKLGVEVSVNSDKLY